MSLKIKKNLVASVLENTGVILSTLYNGQLSTAGTLRRCSTVKENGGLRFKGLAMRVTRTVPLLSLKRGLSIARGFS